ARGLTAVQFAAPVPPCFDGVFMYDTPAGGALVIGDSQSGISVALSGCALNPINVLQITYQHNGNTTPCCAYPVVADPSLGTVTGSDCAFQEMPIAGVVSHFNSDASCECHGNSAPSLPGNPTPQDNTAGQSPAPSMSWFCFDVDGNLQEFDIYIGTTTTPPLVASGLTDPSYAPTLQLNQQYYWYVVARDALGLETQGPLWTFRTRSNNLPPFPPQGPSPLNGESMVPVEVLLTWFGGDPEGDILTYDLYFGTSPTPPLIAQDLIEPQFDPGLLQRDTHYYWLVVASDGLSETSGATWNFTTRPQNLPPGAPILLSPLNGASNVSINADLSWVSSDPDGDVLTFDVYFGTVSPPPLAASNVAVETYDPGTLSPLTLHYWRIVARDPVGATTGSTTFSFTTASLGNLPPIVPFNPDPPNGGFAFSQPTLRWECSDPNGDPLTYDVYFGTTPSPPLVASGRTVKFYSPPTLTAGVYYWRVRASDGQLTTDGPEWSFTRVIVNQPPSAPFNPNPPNNGVALPNAVLTWDASDPNFDPLTYTVYFGTTSPPPLVASGLITKSYVPGPLSIGAQYYWRVDVFDGLVTTNGPIWNFTTIAGGNGDVDASGQVTLDDARCALRLSLPFENCGGVGASLRADVDCSSRVTPRDARCIHKHVLDGSCSFCGDNAPVAAPRDETLIPSLFVLPTWAVGDTLVTQVFVSGVPSLEAFGFLMVMDFNVQLVRAVRIGATIGFQGLHTTPSPAPGVLPGGVAGYTTGGVPANVSVGLVQLHFVLTTGDVGFARMEGFMDDLTGAAPVLISVGDDGPLPVFFQRFEAVQDGDVIDISWDFSSDESVDTYRLYRRAGFASPILIAQGNAASTRSFVDRDVQPSTTYQYELVVRTDNGDEYRSQPATVTTAARMLALGQNHPNPFNPSTTIPFTVAADDSRVRLFVLDASGRLVRTLYNGTKPAGSHTVTWDGRDERGGAASSGVYFYVLDVGGERRTRKMVLLK
ncbi:MAG TPA: FlgD immunoglobulin-like domain containing protein, partial [Candidatus Krumholzibacteria bacterium]|nr:FlgD immunoglobulin-like domain containing protein [Candidatus Krumholzibacteria bacterium]